MDEAPPKIHKSKENTRRPPLAHPPSKKSYSSAEKVLGFSSNSGPSGLGVKLRYVGTLVSAGTTLHKVPIRDELKVPLQVSKTAPPPPLLATDHQTPPLTSRKENKVKNIMKNFIQLRNSPQKMKDSPNLKLKMKTTKIQKKKSENTIEQFFQKTATPCNTISATPPPPSPNNPETKGLTIPKFVQTDEKTTTTHTTHPCPGKQRISASLPPPPQPKKFFNS